jgi:hypothetical protein
VPWQADVAIVGSYFIARYFLTPSSFGQYGWYRGDALTELASQPVTFAGREACQECHDDEYEMLIEHGHKDAFLRGVPRLGSGPRGRSGYQDLHLQLQPMRALPRSESFPSRVAKAD